MASIDSEYDPDVELEVDIVDEYERPGSRLGFFGNSSEEFPSAQIIPTCPSSPSRKRCPSIGWTRSFLRKFSPCKSHKSIVDASGSQGPEMSVESCSPEDFQFLDDASSCSNESDTSESDEESDCLFEVDIMHTEHYEPPTRRKYTCLPSPLHLSSRPATLGVPARHDYGEHGYSRHRLHHLKWFWSLREEEWLETAAYDGVSSRTTSAPSIFQTTTSLSPMSMHPRRGDLVSLRDPFCVHMDRYFVSMPMWTMSKALWMCDLHMAGQGRKQATASSSEPSSDAESDSEDEELSRSCASDDTLVESEEESDGAPVKRLRKSLTEAVPELVCQLSWQTSWYKRTELLLQITRQRS